MNRATKPDCHRCCPHYRDALTTSGTIARLFAAFGKHFKHSGGLATGGQIMDVTIMPVPVNRDTGTENEAIQLDPHLPARSRMAYASPGQESRKEGAPG